MTHSVVLSEDLFARLADRCKETGMPIDRQVLLGTGLWLEEQGQWLEAKKHGCPPHRTALYLFGKELQVEVCKVCGLVELEVQHEGKCKRIEGWLR